MARVEIRIDDPGPAEEIEVVELLVAAGDVVESGQALIEVATDKANIELVAPAAGVVAEVLVANGDVIDPPDGLLLVLETS